MKSQDLDKLNLPDSPGVYYFLNNKKEVLYVGKATSLKDRVKSYFSKDILLTRGPKIEKMLVEASWVQYQETPSVLEALILEASEIKKIQPPYNSKEKDDRSYWSVVITKEEFPRVLVVRGRNIDKDENLDYEIRSVFGPFPHAKELKEALKIIRKIFPFRDEKCKLTGRPCFNAQLGLCPGPCALLINKTKYQKIIKHLELFFDGKKEKLVRELEVEMQRLAKREEFEEADKLKRQIFALDHIQDVALIRQDIENISSGVRIEAYDIAHLGGRDVVGVMVVVSDNDKDLSQYRKFKIKEDKNDDNKNLAEVLLRRFGHPEWRFPDLVVVDGARAQINTARRVLLSLGLEHIGVVAVTKDERHKAKAIVGLQDKNLEKGVLLANAEAHRFAIQYHRKLRGRGFRI